MARSGGGPALRASSLLLPLLAAACAAPPLADAPRPAGIPRPEHPDPSFAREAWSNLNGTWEFDFDPENAGLREEWFLPGRHDFSKRIVVPFPWESELSGLSAAGARGAGWYRRRFTVDPAWAGKRVFLRFGAVDWEAAVWVNGNKMRTHEGGYTPFEFDVTEWVRREGENDLVVRAYDAVEKETPTGKQTGWYTPTSGIWQTVWLEARPAVYVDRLAITPDPAGKRARVKLSVACAGPPPDAIDVTVAGDGLRAPPLRALPLREPSRTYEIFVDVPDPILWHPDRPHLYDLRLTVASPDGSDAVASYFGMRTVKTAKLPGREYEYVLLNDKPVYLLGALDQSFHPKGIYTFPADADIRRDIEIAKEAGLNFLRIHIKVDDPRLYYWADRLGMLMMCDVPSAWTDTPRSRRTWEDTFVEMVRRDFNHPSILSWCLFNETWGLTNHRTPEGQQWVADMVRRAKELDPTRLVEDNSPCNYDHVVTDINSWHFYINQYENARDHIQKVVDKTFPASSFNYIGGHRQGTAPLINSEYGGIAAGNGDQDISWCLKYLTSELRKHPKIGGYVYTELMDIEWEHNGYVNYDRSPKEFGYGEFAEGMTLRDVNSPDFVVIDAPPCPSVPAGGTFEADLLVSHFSERDLSRGVLRWRLHGRVRGGAGTAEFGQGEIAVAPARYDVTKAHRLKVDLPKERALLALAVSLEDGGGRVVARNYINLNVEAPRAARRAALDPRTVALRFRPVDCADHRWAAVAAPAAGGGEKLSGSGAGHVEYHVRLPEEIDPAAVERLTFLAELSAKAQREKVDWRSRRNREDYPQTDGVKHPSDVTISMNGVELRTVTLPDDPADARGIQTHVRRHHPGSYGYRVAVSADPAAVEAIVKAAADRLIRIRLEVKPDAAHAGGLAVFGEDLGRLLLDPTLVLRLRAPVALDASKADAPVAVGAARLAADPVPAEWLVLGPFDNAGGKGFGAVYPPEEGIDLGAEVATLAGPARWKKARGEQAGSGPEGEGDAAVARLRFLQLFLPDEHAVAYALVHAKAPAETEAKLLVGSDDGIKIWVNGRNVHGLDVYRGAKADEDEVPVRLRAGWNRLLFKVTQGTGDWSLIVRLTGADGKPIEGLEFDAEGDLRKQ